jgi:hypothetical protein
VLSTLLMADGLLTWSSARAPSPRSAGQVPWARLAPYRDCAIANAVHHATGVRVRDLPITLDKLLG